MVNTLYVVDKPNDRIKKLDINFVSGDCKFILEVGENGSGDAQFDGVQGICIDDKFVYTTELVNHRIKKLHRGDFTFNAKIGSVGSGNDNFNNPNDICTDGEHLYITDETNHRIHKRDNNDLSLVLASTSLGQLRGIATDGVNVFAASTSSFHLVKLDVGSLVVIESTASLDSALAGVCIDETNVWTITASGTIFKFLKSDLSSIQAIGSYSGLGTWGLTRGNNALFGLNQTETFLRKLSLTDLTSVGIEVSNGDTGTGRCQFGSGSNGFLYSDYEFDTYIVKAKPLHSKRVNLRTLNGALYTYTL